MKMNTLTKPLIELTVLEEVVELLVLLAIIGAIWLIGELVYRLERRWKKK